MKERRRKQKEEKQKAEQFLELQGVKLDKRRKRKSKKEENQKNHGIVVTKQKKTKTQSKKIYNNGFLLARYYLQPQHLIFKNDMINDTNQHFCGSLPLSSLDLSNAALFQRVLNGQKPMAIICERDENFDKYIPSINKKKFDYKIVNHERGFTYLVVATKGKMKNLFDLESLQKDYSNSKISIDVKKVADKSLSDYFYDWDSDKVENWETGLILGYPIENTISIYKNGVR